MGSVTLDRDGFVINGKRQVLMVGSLFYFRIPRAAWRVRMEKMKLAGYHALDVYFPWNHHELAPDVWDFSGERDAEAFLSLAEEVGLYVVARPGPYICSEWDGGGLPAYLFARDMRIRDNDPAYLTRVSQWFDRILPVLRAHSITNNGCIIALQLENELDFFSDTLDRLGYISELRKMALLSGIDVPLFCCSGQSGLTASGGLTPGLSPAMNFYPAPDDVHFGEKVLFYQKWLRDHGFPLLITETHRDHHFLRFLLLLGAKLLGPYNQAGGTDFGFTNAVNNWGAPLSFQTSDYTFASMISPSGELDRKMVLESRILRGLLNALPGLASAQPAALPDGLAMPEGVFATALHLPEGGLVAGIMNYLKGPAEIVWPENGRVIPLLPRRCTLIMSHVSLSPLGLEGEITFSDAVPVKASKAGLVFAAELDSSMIQINGRPLSFPDGAPVHADGLEVSLLSWEEAAAWPVADKESVPVPIALQYRTVENGELVKALPAQKAENGRLSLEQNNIYRGMGFYEAALPCDGAKGLLLSDAADLVTVTVGEKHLGTFSPGGHPLFLPVSGLHGTQPLCVRGEIWGHCNFDDHRTPSLRIKSLKGVKSIVSVTSVTKLPLWQRTDETAGPAPQLTALGSWQTTATPAAGVFHTRQSALGSVRFLHFDGLLGQADVYVGGRLAGRADRFRPWLDISAIPSAEGVLHIACHITKLDFSEPCGVPVLYQGELLQNVTIRAMGETELQGALAACQNNLSALDLPLYFRDGQSIALYGIIRKGDCELTVQGTGIQATVLRGGRVCGRILLHGGELPVMAGGRKDTAYLPACWGEDLQILVRAVTGNAALHDIRCRTVGTVIPYLQEQVALF